MNDNGSNAERSNSHVELEQAIEEMAERHKTITTSAAELAKLKDQQRDRYKAHASAGFATAKLKRLVSEKLALEDEKGREQLEMDLDDEVMDDLELDTLRDAMGFPTKREAQHKARLKEIADLAQKGVDAIEAMQGSKAQ